MFHSSVFWVVLAEDLIEILKWNAGFFDSSIYSKNIVDIVETGVTLRENGLEVVEDVVPISARLIANTVSLKLRQTEIEALIQKIEEALSK